MDEYNLNGIRIYNVNNSSNSTVQYQNTLHGRGKPTPLHDAGSVAFTDFATWTECVT
jgi:hypothetical protein